MKNYVQPGDTITVPAPAQVVSGQAILIGSIVGVAQHDAANGALAEFKLTGVFDVPKAPSQAWTVGALVYWDAGNARFTTVATGNRPQGIAVAAVGSGAGETTGRVRLQGVGAVASA